VKPERDQSCWGGRGVAFDRGSHGQEGVREHGQGGPAVPGGPAADLVLINADQAVSCLERFLDAPALTCHGDQGAQRDGPRGVAAQVGQLAGGVIAADQPMMDAGIGGVFGLQPKPRPGLQPWAVAAQRSTSPATGALHITATDLPRRYRRRVRVAKEQHPD
jgi:hypothetical protein